MSRGRKANFTVIGLFVLGGMAIAVAAAVVFASGRFFQHKVPIVCYFSGSVNGLNVGAPVKFRGVQFGEVKDIRFGLREAAVPSASVRIPVWVDIDQSRLHELHSRVVNLTKERLERLIENGLRAQLQTESFVTGVRYVGVDFFPGSPVVRVLPPDSNELEVPTIPTTLEQASGSLIKIVDRLQNVDLEGLVQSARNALDGANDLVRSPEIQRTLVEAREALASIKQTSQTLGSDGGATLKDLQTTMSNLDATLKRLQTLTDPQAPLVIGLTEALADLGEAARSVQELASYLERRPNAVLTGRPGS